MSWQQLETLFNRAFSFSFSKRKWLLVFSVLALCGLISVICRGISIHSTEWIQMSLAFLPIFLCAGLLLALGLILNNLYQNEIDGKEIHVVKTLFALKQLFLGIPYLAVPLIFAYLILWMILGIFYLLKEIPKVGSFLGSLFSFGPFLLVFGSIALAILSFLLLFYITPAAAAKSDLHPKLAREVLQKLKENPFRSFVMPLIALFPILFIVGFLSLSAVVTHLMYVGSQGTLSVIIKWFFIMLPFCALLAPAVIFFFNFSFETYALMEKTQQVPE